MDSDRGGTHSGGYTLDDAPTVTSRPALSPQVRGLARLGRSALPVIGVTALIALTISGTSLLLPAADRTENLGLIRVVALLAAGIGLAVLLIRRPGNTTTGRAEQVTKALSLAALAMVLLALLSLPTSDVLEGPTDGRRSGTNGSVPLADPASGGGGSASTGNVGSRDDPVEQGSADLEAALAEAEGSDEDDGGLFGWSPDLGSMEVGPGLLVALLLTLALSVVGLYTLQQRRDHSRQHPADGDEVDDVAEPLPVEADEAEAGLVASLDEAQESGDPRQRIMAAYLRLLEALAAAGAPRHLEEAPHEHLSRVLGPLGVRPEPVHKLAELFVLARFSDQPVGDRHREAAVAALETGLAELRARDAGVQSPDTDDPVQPGSEPG